MVIRALLCGLSLYALSVALMLLYSVGLHTFSRG